MSVTTVYAAEVLDTIAKRRNLEQFTDEVMALCALMYAFIRPLRRDDNAQAIFDYLTDKCKELGIEADE